MSKIQIFSQNSKFFSKIQIFSQNSKFFSKIQIFSQNSKFFSKIQFFLKKSKFFPKNPIFQPKNRFSSEFFRKNRKRFFKNRIFAQKIDFFVKNRNVTFLFKALSWTGFCSWTFCGSPANSMILLMTMSDKPGVGFACFCASARVCHIRARKISSLKKLSFWKSGTYNQDFLGW